MNAAILLLALTLAIPKTDATVGVAAIDLESGKTVTVRPDEPFPMASVFKFPLAITVLFEVDHGPLSLDHQFTIDPHDFSPGQSPIRDRAKGKPVTLTLRELVVAAVSDSDNTAGDYLLKLVTPATVNERMEALHAGDIHVDRTEREIIETKMYEIGTRDSSTPVAMTALLGIFFRNREGLSPASHDFLMRTMTKTSNPVRIGKLLPTGCTVAHKTGTMPGIMNDAGMITTPQGHHIAIAIFTKGAKSSEEEREQLIAQIATEVYDKFTRVGPTLSRSPKKAD